MTQWLSDEEQATWRAFRRMRALLDQAVYRDLAADSGLSEPDYDVLSTLSEGKGRRWRAGDLAERLLWSSSRLSHQVRRMEQRGLVLRLEDPADARGAIVTLTPEGLRALRAAAPGHVASVRRHFIDALSPAERRTIRTVGERLVAALEREAGEGIGREGRHGSPR